jgi:DNA mismatch endonuclease (patch repair protein)
MADVHDKATRSHNMAMIRRSDTKPEVHLRKMLWRRGLRYRLNADLPGKPDLVFPKFGAVVFVDGCFWHACPKHMIWPKSNVVFWRKKIEANKTRDKVVNRKLKSLGWYVMRVWEHEINRDAAVCARRIEKMIRRKTNAGQRRKAQIR